MVKKGYTPEQIINKLREAELQLQQGATVAAKKEEMGISPYWLDSSDFWLIYNGYTGNYFHSNVEG